MIGAAIAIGGRLLAGAAGRAAAGQAVKMGASEALAGRVGSMASKATVQGGEYAAQRIEQRRAEQKAPRP